VASPSARTGDVAGGLAVGVDQEGHTTGGTGTSGGGTWHRSTGPVTGKACTPDTGGVPRPDTLPARYTWSDPSVGSRRLAPPEDSWTNPDHPVDGAASSMTDSPKP
jgi:hypothetical protein